MDLNEIIRGDNAQNIQLVVSAKDLRDLLDGAIAFAKQEIQERDEPKYYTREQLRDEVLHVSDPTLVSYRKRGLIPEPVTIGGRVLYNKADVKKALEDKGNRKQLKLKTLL